VRWGQWLLLVRWRTSALDGSVDRRARDLEQLGEVEGGVLAAAPQLDQQGFLLAVDSWPGPAGWAGRLALSRAEAVLSYLLVLVLTVLCALWGAFLVPLRLFGVSAPVSVLFALANALLVFAGRRVARSHWGGAVPACCGWAWHCGCQGRHRAVRAVIVLLGPRRVARDALGLGTSRAEFGPPADRPGAPTMAVAAGRPELAGCARCGRLARLRR